MMIIMYYMLFTVVVLVQKRADFKNVVHNNLYKSILYGYVYKVYALLEVYPPFFVPVSFILLHIFFSIYIRID